MPRTSWSRTRRVPNLEGLDLDKAGIRRDKADPRRLAALRRAQDHQPHASMPSATPRAGRRSAHLAVHQAGLVVAQRAVRHAGRTPTAHLVPARNLRPIPRSPRSG